MMSFESQRKLYQIVPTPPILKIPTTNENEINFNFIWNNSQYNFYNEIIKYIFITYCQQSQFISIIKQTEPVFCYFIPSYRTIVHNKIKISNQVTVPTKTLKPWICHGWRFEISITLDSEIKLHYHKTEWIE